MKQEKDRKFKIDWEQQGRYIIGHPNFVPFGYIFFHMDDELGINVLLSLQYALLDRIPNALRGITCDWTDSEIMVHCFFDGEISEGNEDLMLILQMDMEHVFYKHKVTVECIRKDEPENLNPFTLKDWVFRRRKKMYELGADVTVNPVSNSDDKDKC